MRLRADGTERCADCASAPEEGHVRCAQHAAEHRERERMRREERRARGLCITCGAPVEEGRRYCKGHLSYFAERN